MFGFVSFCDLLAYPGLFSIRAACRAPGPGGILDRRGSLVERVELRKHLHPLHQQPVRKAVAARELDGFMSLLCGPKGGLPVLSRAGLLCPIKFGVHLLLRDAFGRLSRINSCDQVSLHRALLLLLFPVETLSRLCFSLHAQPSQITEIKEEEEEVRACLCMRTANVHTHTHAHIKRQFDRSESQRCTTPSQWREIKMLPPSCPPHLMRLLNMNLIHFPKTE